MKKSQQGFAPILILFIVAAIAVGGGTYYYSQNNKSDSKVSAEQKQATTTLSTSSTTLGTSTSGQTASTTLEKNTSVTVTASTSAKIAAPVVNPKPIIDRAADAKTKGNLAMMRSAAEIYYASHDNYSVAASCASAMFIDAESGMKGLTTAVQATAGTKLMCKANTNVWVASAKLTDGTTWCVDSTGRAETGTADLIRGTCLVK